MKSPFYYAKISGTNQSSYTWIFCRLSKVLFAGISCSSMAGLCILHWLLWSADATDHVSSLQRRLVVQSSHAKGDHEQTYPNKPIKKAPKKKRAPQPDRQHKEKIKQKPHPQFLPADEPCYELSLENVLSKIIGTSRYQSDSRICGYDSVSVPTGIFPCVSGGKKVYAPGKCKASFDEDNVHLSDHPDAENSAKDPVSCESSSSDLKSNVCDDSHQSVPTGVCELDINFGSITQIPDHKQTITHIPDDASRRHDVCPRSSSGGWSLEWNKFAIIGNCRENKEFQKLADPDSCGLPASLNLVTNEEAFILKSASVPSGDSLYGDFGQNHVKSTHTWGNGPSIKHWWILDRFLWWLLSITSATCQISAHAYVCG